MKKLLFLCAFVMTAGMASAQADVTPAKKCCKKSKTACTKSKTAEADSDTKVLDSETRVASAMTAADIAAEKNEDIIRKECSYSNTVSYYKKSVCADSGKVKMAEVSYDQASDSFVELTASEQAENMEEKAMNASDKSGTGEKKACCAGKSGKACCKKGV